MAESTASDDAWRLLRPVDPARDHIRGGGGADVVTLVVYGDYLCPYCRRLRLTLAALRDRMGSGLAYVFRHFPNERAHPGAEYFSRAAEAAAAQGRFWEMHDRIYDAQPPLAHESVFAFAEAIGLDMARFRADMESAAVRERVAADLDDGRRNGVTGTPAFFIDGLSYDGAWDFHSMLEVLQRSVAERLQRSARVFASLPASAGIVLLLAALAALICANTALAPYYREFVEASFSIGPPGSALSLNVGEWCSEGLLALFFLLVGLEIRREVTAGALTDPRAAALPILAAIGGVLAPAAIYLAINRGATAPGWSVPTATDVAFTLGILAVLGTRVPTALRVFVAALAVVDDILSMLTLAIFYPHALHPEWLLGAAVAVAAMFALNRARVYVGWPYVLVTIALWLALHAAGIHGALAGVILAAFLPTRPAPKASTLLAQVATALAALENAENEARKTKGTAERIKETRVWEWASTNLSAAAERLLSPVERVERALAPWSAYVVLPLFAFSATGVLLAVNLDSRDDVAIFVGVVLGLVIGKPLGISIASWLAIRARIAIAPIDVGLREFIGAACLCGVGDTMALLMADQAFPQSTHAAISKIGVLAGSVLAAVVGALILAWPSLWVRRTMMTEPVVR